MEKRKSSFHITRRGFIQGTVSSALGLVCGSGLGNLFSGRAVYAAEASGSLVHYLALPLVFMNPVVAIFNKDYPNIKVTLERSDTYVLYQKVINEASAGRLNGDVWGVTDLVITKDLIKKGILAEYSPPNENDYPAAFKVKGYIYPGYLLFVAPMYNTKLVSKEELPKTWADFLNPKWKGKLCSSTPALGGTTWVFYYFLRKKFGVDYWKALAKQNVTIYETTATAASQKVITGENLILLDTAHQIAYTHRQNKEPVDMIFPKEGVPFSMQSLALLKNGPNRNTGKIYLDWLLSKKGQTAMCLQNGFYSALSGIPNAEWMPPKDQINIWYPDWDEWGSVQKDWVNEWKEIFQK
jgi:iron(III) transport system substrate-binding protein